MLAGYHLARHPDDERFRAWEIPGTAHADNYTIRVGVRSTTDPLPMDDIVAAYAPTNELMGTQLSYLHQFRATAPLRPAGRHREPAHLGSHRRTRTDRTARSPLTDADPPELDLDANGLATGGVRTPWVDVPIAKHIGHWQATRALCLPVRLRRDVRTAALRAFYPRGSAEYRERFTEALDGAIESGFIRPADRSEILELAAATFRS